MRVVPLMSQTATILQKYLNMWHLMLRGNRMIQCFVNHQGKRLTRPGVTYILNKYMAQVSWMEDKKGLLRMLSVISSKAMHLPVRMLIHYIPRLLDMQIERLEVYARADAIRRQSIEPQTLYAAVCSSFKSKWNSSI